MGVGDLISGPHTPQHARLPTGSSTQSSGGSLFCCFLFFNEVQASCMAPRMFWSCSLRLLSETFPWWKWLIGVFLPAIKWYQHEAGSPTHRSLPTASANMARSWDYIFQYLSSCCLQMLYSLHRENRKLENASMQLHPENFRYRPCLSKMSLCVDSCMHIWAIEDTELNAPQTTSAENCQDLFSVK